MNGTSVQSIKGWNRAKIHSCFGVSHSAVAEKLLERLRELQALISTGMTNRIEGRKGVGG